MCGCQAHWKLGAGCTCGCGDHAYLRVQQLNGNGANSHTHTITTTTSSHTHTNAPGVTRAVLYGSHMQITPIEEVGPSDAEVAEAIESIKRALPGD